MSNIEVNGTAVLYCRYSSHNQRDVSIDQQISACEAYAERSGMKIVKVYADRAMTGTNDRRPQFQRMIAEAAAMDYQYVIVYSLDRFSRDRYDSARYKHELKEHGKRVISATEPITDDPAGQLMESIFEGWAAYYSAELAAKIGRGLRHNAERCLVTGAIPYGYTKGNDGRYAVQPEQAEVVREIYRRVLNGENIIRVAESLNERGLRTKTGAKWNRSSFNTILKNERYTGVYLYQDIRVEGGVPPILDRETFDAMQGYLERKSNPRGPQRRRRENGTYLLTGKIYCGECGNPMVGISGTSKKGHLHFYYICKGRRAGKHCDKKPVPRDSIECEVAAAIREYILTDDRIERLADHAVQRNIAAQKNSRLSAMESELSAVEKAISNLLSAIEQGIVTASTKRRLQDLEAESERLTAEIAIERYAHKPVEVSRDDLIAVLRLYQRGDIESKAYQETLIDAFVVRVYVFDDHLKITFNLGENKSEDITFPREAADPSVFVQPPDASTTPTLYEPIPQIYAVGISSYLLICPRTQKKTR